MIRLKRTPKVVATTLARRSLVIVRKVRDRSYSAFYGLIQTVKAIPSRLLTFFMGKNRPQVYAITYGVSVFVFAIFYTFISGDFYHSNAKYELSLKNDLHAIQTGLQAAIERTIDTQYKDAVIVDHGWTLTRKSVRFTSLNYSDNVFTARLNLEVKRISNGYPESLRTNHVGVSLRRNSGFPMLKDDLSYASVMHSVGIDKAEFLDFDPHVLLMKLPDDFKLDRSKITPRLIVPVGLDKAMTDYGNAIEGFPTNSSGGFERMLYLSAVTITTLGFGDILPVTPTARFAVASEAVWGIVLMGYFLSSIASAAASSTNSKPESFQETVAHSSACPSNPDPKTGGTASSQQESR